MSWAIRVRQRVRTLLIRRAHDAASRISGRSLLVVAPHPDDETLGCGGRILRATASGARVVVVVATDGSASHGGVGGDELRRIRRTEFETACAKLGVGPEDIVSIGLPDGRLSGEVETLASELAEILIRVQPDDVCVTCLAENNPDHAATAQATASAIMMSGWRGRCLWYPIWLWSDWPVSRRHAKGGAIVRATRIAVRREVEVVRLDPATLDGKREALSSYASQLGQLSVSGASTELPEDVIARALDGVELFFTRSP